MKNKLVALLCLGLALRAGEGFGQALTAAAAAVAAAPSFDVASIKPGDASTHSVRMSISPNRFLTQNVPLKMLIEYAYDLKSDDQLSGIPGALNSKVFDIDAKPDEALLAQLQKLPQQERSDQMRVMMQGLLADRFKLKVSRQTKELPVYALVVAKGGVKMKEAAAPPPNPSGTPPPLPTPGSAPKPGMIMMTGRGEVTGTAVPITSITNILSRQPETGGRVVIDRTGLTGNYDWSLKWTPDAGGPMGGGPGGPGGGDGAPPSDSNAPTFFTAIQEQLGLKLESQKAPVEVVVVDHIEEPSAN